MSLRLLRQTLVRCLRNTRAMGSSAPPHGASGGKDDKHGTAGLPLGPGAQPTVIPTPYEQASGMERIEYLAEAEGVQLFLDSEPLKIEKRGTLGEPVLVESIQGRRIVGCTGFPKYSHQPIWMELHGFEKPRRCVDCGQAFKLTPAMLEPYKAPSK